MVDRVLLEVDDAGVATVSFNRPEKHNAFDDESDRQLFAILEELHGRADIRAVIIRGEGASFSSGRDTSVLGHRPEGVTDLDYIAAGHEKTRLLLTMPAPTIAALKGWVIGGSFERALLCDLRVAAEDARMVLPEVQHGVIPDSGGVARLFQMAGHGIAADLALTGRVIDAAEARSHGIVSRVVPVDDLDAEVQAIGATLAERPRLAVEQAVATIRALTNPETSATLDRELLAQTVVMADRKRPS